jgi:hypothetical protein
MQVGEQPLGLRDAVSRYDEKACRKPARERGNERSISGTWKTGDQQLSRGSRQCIEHSRERRQTFERIEQTWK